jgi:RNA polymerase sigma-70 factor, ECF subfamily
VHARKIGNFAPVGGFLGVGAHFLADVRAAIDSVYRRGSVCAMSQAGRGPDLNKTDDGSDGSLIRRFRAGEEDAATKLYKRYAERLHRLAQRNTAIDLTRRFDAEDIVQSVFRTFFRRVRTGLYDLPAGDELWRLLLVISLNKIRALAVYHRAQKRSVSSTIAPDLELLSQVVDSNADELALATLKMVIDEVLHDLPEVQQRMIVCRIDGCQVEEIAAETGRSKRTVERVLQDFRQRLRRIIDVRQDNCEADE